MAQPSDPYTLHAPPNWRVLEWWSDVHLQPSAPATFAAWQSYLHHSNADAVFILGDWLELWVGDDALDDPEDGAFWQDCAHTVRQAGRGRPIFLIPGNRDFLIGPRFLAAAGVQALPDPTVLVWNQMRLLLSHGDALCWDDHAYMRFRAQVRDPEWQSRFLAHPLAERLAWAKQVRSTSEHQKQQENTAWVDVHPAAVEQALHQHHCTHLIHGHTHMPAVHRLADGCTRWVLSDWEADATPPRLSVLRWELGQAMGVSCDIAPQTIKTS